MVEARRVGMEGMGGESERECVAADSVPGDGEDVGVVDCGEESRPLSACSVSTAAVDVDPDECDCPSAVRGVGSGSTSSLI